MEVPLSVFIVLLAALALLSAIVLILLYKLHRRDRQALALASLREVSISNTELYPWPEAATSSLRSSDSDRQSFITCIEELRKSNITLGRTSCTMTPSVRRGLRRPRQNSNEVWHYKWLHDLLQSIVDGSASQSVLQVDTHQKGTPLFLLAGACPNAISGMQALMYCKMPTSIDFWWVKPDGSGEALQRETLNKHSKGAFKNSSERGQKHFLPLAEKFMQGAVEGDFSYGVDKSDRAFIDVESNGHKTRMLVYLVWQESWSMALWGTRFIEGKICYQKTTPDSNSAQSFVFFARQYRITDGAISIDTVEETVSSLLPPEPFQEMHDMTIS